MAFIQWLAQPDVLIYLAGGTFVLGYLITNQIALRLLVTLGTLFYIVYYFTAAATPLWGAINTSLLQGAANLLGLFLLLAARSKLAIPRAYRDLYHLIPHLPPGDFAALMRGAMRKQINTEIRVTLEDQPVDQLFFLISGRARVAKGGESFEMASGAFIGEIALLLNQPASSTVTVLPGSEILVWSSEDLLRRTSRRPRLKLTLDAAISRDMAHKVARAVAADRHPTQG